MLVKLTSGYTNPPHVKQVSCDRVAYNNNNRLIRMYRKTKPSKPEELIAFAYYDEWLKIEVVYSATKSEVIYEKDKLVPSLKLQADDVEK